MTQEADMQGSSRGSRRVHRSVLSHVEKRVLEAIARRIPLWLHPDNLTALGVAGSVMVLLGYASSVHDARWLWLANFGIVLHWLGDSLDGTLARVRGTERPRYGFFLDQCIDVLGNLIIAIGLGITTFVRLDTVLLVLAAYHMLTIYTFVRTIVTDEMRVSVMGLGPTELRLGIVVMNMLFLIAGPQPIAFFGRDISW